MQKGVWRKNSEFFLQSELTRPLSSGSSEYFQDGFSFLVTLGARNRIVVLGNLFVSVAELPGNQLPSCPGNLCDGAMRSSKSVGCDLRKP